jgi:hypothetical protein
MYLFEAFDEQKKSGDSGAGAQTSNVENHWGVFTEAGKAKYTIAELAVPRASTPATSPAPAPAGTGTGTGTVPAPAPTAPGGTGTCNNPCTQAASGTSPCRNRVAWVRTNLGMSLADAVSRVNSECTGQCSCNAANIKCNEKDPTNLKCNGSSAWPCPKSHAECRGFVQGVTWGACWSTCTSTGTGTSSPSPRGGGTGIGGGGDSSTVGGGRDATTGSGNNVKGGGAGVGVDGVAGEAGGEAWVGPVVGCVVGGVVLLSILVVALLVRARRAGASYSGGGGGERRTKGTASAGLEMHGGVRGGPWTPHVDMSSGETYYSNPAGETTWELPSSQAASDKLQY